MAGRDDRQKSGSRSGQKRGRFGSRSAGNAQPRSRSASSGSFKSKRADGFKKPYDRRQSSGSSQSANRRSQSADRRAESSSNDSSSETDNRTNRVNRPEQQDRYKRESLEPRNQRRRSTAGEHHERGRPRTAGGDRPEKRRWSASGERHDAPGRPAPAGDDYVRADDEQTDRAPRARTSRSSSTGNASSSEDQGRSHASGRRPDNVHLSLNPKILELARDIAEENEMPLNEYLAKALILVINTHAKKLGLGQKRLVTEYTKEHKPPRTAVSRKKP